MSILILRLKVKELAVFLVALILSLLNWQRFLVPSHSTHGEMHSINKHNEMHTSLKSLRRFADK